MKYERRIKSLAKKIVNIELNRWRLSQKTFWLQEGTYASEEKEFKAVKDGSKPMALINPRPDSERLIKKAKSFCDKTSGYSYDIVLNNKFVYGKNFNVFAAKILHMFPNFDVALGTILGYGKKHVAAFQCRLDVMYRNVKIEFPEKPIRSKNPIKDVLNGKRKLTQINFKADQGFLVKAKTVNKKIKELERHCKKNKKLDFVVLYKGKYGNPYIVFGQKKLINQRFISERS